MEHTRHPKINEFVNKTSIPKNMFVPGFLFGVLVSFHVRQSLTFERYYARPWSTIGVGLLFGSLFHYWTWKKRLIMEDICHSEDVNSYKSFEKGFAHLKAGDDLEKHYMVKYLKDEHSV